MVIKRILAVVFFTHFLFTIALIHVIHLVNHIIAAIYIIALFIYKLKKDAQY